MAIVNSCHAMCIIDMCDYRHRSDCYSGAGLLGLCRADVSRKIVAPLAMWILTRNQLTVITVTKMILLNDTDQ